MSAPVSKIRVVIILLIGLLAISSAAVLIKSCDAPALTIAFYRVAIGSLFYFSVTRFQKNPLLKKFTPHTLRLALLSGLALALHFATWITSLNYTSVASSVVLVCTSPIWVAIGGFVFLRERLHRFMIVGIVMALLGSIIISGGDVTYAQQSLKGNLLAVAGAICAAAYLLIGRRLRRELDTFPYVTVVYATAALFTLLWLAIAGLPLAGFDSRTVLFLLAIAFLPQIIGHTSFNWALKYFSATAVAIVVLGEPVGASVLAWIFLGETITLGQFAGMILILAGVGITLYGENKKISNKSTVKQQDNRENKPH